MDFNNNKTWVRRRKKLRLKKANWSPYENKNLPFRGVSRGLSPPGIRVNPPLVSLFASHSKICPLGKILAFIWYSEFYLTKFFLRPTFAFFTPQRPKMESNQTVLACEKRTLENISNEKLLKEFSTRLRKLQLY